MRTVTQEEFEAAVATILRAQDEGVLQRRIDRSTWGAKTRLWSDWVTATGSETFFPQDGIEYRIKPKPREWWLVTYGSPAHTARFESAEAAVELQNRLTVCSVMDHVREVLEDEE